MVFAEMIHERKSIASTLLVTMAILFAVLWFGAPALHHPTSHAHTMTAQEMSLTNGAGGAGEVLGWCAVGVGIGILAIGVIALAGPAVVGAAIVEGIFGSTIATALGEAAVPVVGWGMVGGGGVVAAGGGVGVALSQ